MYLPPNTQQIGIWNAYDKYASRSDKSTGLDKKSQGMGFNGFYCVT